MRIYNKRNFAAGILSLALAVACGVVLAVTGFQTKWLIALVLLLAAGPGRQPEKRLAGLPDCG